MPNATPVIFDLVAAGDITLAIVGAVATYYSFRARGLFLRDPMGRVLTASSAGFLVLTLCACADVFAIFMDPEVRSFLFRIGMTASIAIITVAMIFFVRWASSTAEPETPT